MNNGTRDIFTALRRKLRGRPTSTRSARNRQRLKGDLKMDDSPFDLEMKEYDVQSLHIPYGPGWDARRIERLVYAVVSCRSSSGYKFIADSL